jgi:deoxyribonuclease-4
MRFGIHVRIGQGLSSALDTAARLNCEAIQLFSGNPNGWANRPYEPNNAASFSSRAGELDIHPVILHTPYLVNLASPDDVIWRKSVEALALAVVKAEQIGAGIVVTHIGSHKGQGRALGLSRIAEAIRYALDASPTASIALELGAGAGNSMASSFGDAANILDTIQNAARVGIGIDTAHLWGAGYDISTEEGVDAMLTEARSLIGLDKLLLVHLNDTLVELQSHRDVHHHIGEGKIGLEGFRAIVNHPAVADLPGILETPMDDPGWDVRNLETLRRLRAEHRALET